MAFDTGRDGEGKVCLWKNWNRYAAPGCVLGLLPMLLLWPESVRHVLFFWALGTALMCSYIHRNGSLLPKRPVVAWALILFVAPSPFILATYLLVKSDLLPLYDSMFQLVVICLSTLAAAGLLAWIRQRVGDSTRFARLLRLITPDPASNAATLRAYSMRKVRNDSHSS